ncbi:uncharacterized protein LOC112350309 [Selaginella moellendorffii]|uniref:uncharacterized protein LOC112350309 n=1 Tax=Selaginella moellendorffii TaxID=88036 RepID=UPI000D1CA040|nr:uncharacterized protein LOC112350309 [Selaginella moellendorffii]|eukprot:XP_024542036.1 uncharacterized protein LOC112350309 [Selaginella moellendorffii]
MEQLKVAGLLRPPVELLTCGLCARWLSQASPLSSLPVVGVLSCGHVFHAECLEHSVPQGQKQDPPCPHCVSSERSLKSASSKSLTQSSSSKGILKSFSHASTSAKNKLSRVGVITDDGSGAGKEPQLSKFPSSSGSSKSQLSTFFGDKTTLGKSISKRAFPFIRRKDSLLGECRFRKPGSPARVSPEKDFTVEEHSQSKEARSTSFRSP